MRAGTCRQCADNEEHDSFRPSQKTDVAFRNEALCARARVADHHRAHHAGAGKKDIEGRMKLCVAGIEDHQAYEHHHVRQAIERRIKKAAIARHSSRKSRDLAVEHVEQVRDDQDDAGPEKISKAKQQTRSDVYGYADERENVRIKMTSRQPTNHGIDDSLTSPTDACAKHSLESYSLKGNKSARDDKNGIIRVSRKLVKVNRILRRCAGASGPCRGLCEP